MPDPGSLFHFSTLGVWSLRISWVYLHHALLKESLMKGNRPLSGQSTLVTGAATGIGRAIAESLAKAGADVAINHLSHPEEAARITDELSRNHGIEAVALQADVSSEEEVQDLFARAIGRFGTLDIVVCNAGIQQDAAFVDMTLDQWRKVLDVNLTGAFLCAREGAREFLGKGRGAGKVKSNRQDPLYQFSSPGDPLGRSCQLRRQQRGHLVADEKSCPGAGAPRRPGQQHRSRGHQDPDKQGCLAGPGVPQRALEFDPLRPCRRAC